MPDYNAQGHIQRFLADNPQGHLYVLVGYASVWGLAWLHENTPGRRVTLIIGDTRPHHFGSATNRNRAKALQFLRRKDVLILSWYRSGKSAQGMAMLHAKAWVIAGPKNRSARAAMIGSANLTRTGLQDNWEMMCLVAGGELSRIWRQLDGLVQGRTVSRKPWDAESRLMEAIEEGRRVQELTKAMPTRPRRTPAAGKRSGCLTLAAAIGVLAASIATTLLLLL